MKLTSLLQCGCVAMWPEDAPETTPVPPLGNVATAAPRARRRGVRRSFKPWRPSLSAISERGSTTAVAAGAVDGKRGSDESGKAKATVCRRVLPRSHSDDNRYKDVSSVISAISPTAYLF
ncbi:uncharacterized protein LOC121974415 [Zingiber officinale]|uniref:Uncharacterized protein n=1 Tax=Zingiber officinale TaxID=94328 RepID=A0A8J5LD74_ZINOF|nr:uncharacterized protein LOC121974415 [Zingiber officinale]XP_042381401.1 uncharacterized protein LOC121974415 [Zingiber officinale]KAG6509487.1 hypothetical protein ZIOFF_027480 [Zingiber officinale]